MNLSDAMLEAINRQINAELYSSYLYLSMAAYLESVNLDGMAGWMKVQAKEETEHAEKFYGYVYERGGRVVLDTIEKPPAEWDSPTAVFEGALEHERKVTAMINGLMELAEQEGDRAAQIFLQWFISEQVEEEAHAGAIVDRLKMISGSPQALLMLDRDLGQRTAE